MTDPTLREVLQTQFNDIPANFKNGSTTAGAIKDFFRKHSYSIHKKKEIVRPFSHFFVMLSHGKGLRYYEKMELYDNLPADEVGLVFLPPSK